MCGKCASLLERVFKFDSVIARVKVLSTEKLHKLTQEKDKIRQWLRQNYQQRHLEDFHLWAATNREEEGQMEKESYREMLEENMALSEYEFWSDKWEACPYFIRTGKRCRKGKGCEGCDSLRVSDSNYESVCGIPRHLPSQTYKLLLSRDKSQSMPLHWQRTPSSSFSPTSLTGSCLSLQAASCTGSIQSQDSLEDFDTFHSSPPESINFVLNRLRCLKCKPVRSPSGSRIPVLDKKDEKLTGEITPSVVARILNFGDIKNGEGDVNEDDGDILTELNEEFMPLCTKSNTDRLHHSVEHLQGQLNQAVNDIETLELKNETGKRAHIKTLDKEKLPQVDSQDYLLQSFACSLHCRERLIQECMGLIKRLCMGEGVTNDLENGLIEKITENTNEILSDTKAALKFLRLEMSDREKMERKEIEVLKKAASDRELDLDTLTSVIQCNQDTINDLHVILEENSCLQKNIDKERKMWRKREQTLVAVQHESNVLLRNFQEKLENLQKKIPTFTTPTVGGMSEEEVMSGAGQVDGVALCQQVTELTTTLQEYQDMVQTQQENHKERMSSMMAQLKDTRQQLRQKEKEKKESERLWQNRRDEMQREEKLLMERLEKRDKLIEHILQDVEERDHLFRELQLKLQNQQGPESDI